MTVVKKSKRKVAVKDGNVVDIQYKPKAKPKPKPKAKAKAKPATKAKAKSKPKTKAKAKAKPVKRVLDAETLAAVVESQKADERAIEAEREAEAMRTIRKLFLSMALRLYSDDTKVLGISRTYIYIPHIMNLYNTYFPSERLSEFEMLRLLMKAQKEAGPSFSALVYKRKDNKFYGMGDDI